MNDDIEVNDLESQIEPEFSFKLVVLGDSGVGKTSIIKYEIKNAFINNKDSSIVFEHSFKNYCIFEKIVRFQIWDTCGEDIYYSALKNFYRSALCIIVVFALDDLDSFNSLGKWIQDIKNNHNSDEYILVLIGNKLDRDNPRIISKKLVDEFCKNNNIENYFESSAKTGENIHEIFKTLVKKLFLKFAMPIIDDKKETKKEINNSLGIKKSVIYVENKADCCKTCYCNNQ